MTRCQAAAVLAACFTFLPHLRAHAESVAQFYHGRTVALMIPSAPGGVNDLASRLVAQHLGKHIPGNPAIVPQNMSGAAGVIGANRMFNAAEKDGTVIGLIDRGTPQTAMLGDPNVRFDPVRFTWLGSLSSYANDAYILALNSDVAAQSVEDLRKPGISATLGGLNAGTTSVIFALIAKDVLGLNLKLVRGYTGAAPIFLAQQTREVDGQMVGLSSLKAGQPALWASKAVRALVQFGRGTRLPELSDVPTGRELAKDDAARALIAFAEQPFLAALPYVAPPDIPPDRAKALGEAFMAMTRDPDYQRDAARLSLDQSPIDGAAVRDLMVRAKSTPKDVIAHYLEIVGN